MEKSKKFLFSSLELVFPPLSNFEAVNLKDSPAEQNYLSKSQIYMMGIKPKAIFVNPKPNDNFSEINFDLYENGIFVDKGSISLINSPSIKNHITQKEPEIIGFLLKENYIEISYVSNETGERRLLERFTPENVVWYKSRNSRLIQGMNNYKSLCSYDLLYVGISKSNNSFERLIKNAHTGRAEILSLEEKPNESVRITSDELILFFFDIKTDYLISLGDDCDTELSATKEHIIADAEKAFVNLLKPKYNKITFNNYPISKDGLCNQNVDVYAYAINEELIFKTPNGIFSGSEHGLSILDNRGDCISIDAETNNVTVWRGNPDT